MILVISRLSNSHISQTSLKQVTVPCSTICTIFAHILSLSSLTLHAVWVFGCCSVRYYLMVRCTWALSSVITVFVYVIYETPKESEATHMILAGTNNM